MTEQLPSFDGIILPLVWEDVSDRCRDAVGINGVYRIITREDGTASLRLGSHDRIGTDFPSREQAVEAANDLHRASMLTRINVAAVGAAYRALQASTRYLEGTNPFHFSNGVRNQDQRQANVLALEGLRGTGPK